MDEKLPRCKKGTRRNKATKQCDIIIDLTSPKFNNNKVTKKRTLGEEIIKKLPPKSNNKVPKKRNLEEDTKLTRCKKGFHRNKITKTCDKYGVIDLVSPEAPPPPNPRKKSSLIKSKSSSDTRKNSASKKNAATKIQGLFYKAKYNKAQTLKKQQQQHQQQQLREREEEEKKQRAENKLKGFFKKNIAQIKHKIRTKFLKSVCSDSGVCIAFGKEEDKIKKFFNNFVDFTYVVSRRKVGASSVNGFVYEITYERENYFAHAILKSSSNAGADNLSYEYLVGTIVNKQFAKRLPCFVETYGLFQYKKQLLDDDLNDMADEEMRQLTAFLTNKPAPGITTKRAREYAKILIENGVANSIKLKRKLTARPTYLIDLGVDPDDAEKIIAACNNDEPMKHDLTKQQLVKNKNYYETMKDGTNNEKLEDFLLNNKVTTKNACENSMYLCILTQNIKDAKTLKSMLESKNGKKFAENDLASCLYQIYFALAATARYFTHYDLHYQNVLLYEPVENSYIDYRYENSDGSECHFKSKYIVKIIDYGRSFIKDKTDPAKGSAGEYARVCAEPACERKCGDKVGYYFLSTAPNESKDLWLFEILKNLFLHLCPPALTILIKQLRYLRNGPENVNVGYPHNLNNVVDAEKFLRYYLMDKTELQANNVRYDPFRKLGDLSIRSDHDMNFVPAPR
jgi:hypothetical protein